MTTGTITYSKNDFRSKRHQLTIKNYQYETVVRFKTKNEALLDAQELKETQPHFNYTIEVIE